MSESGPKTQPVRQEYESAREQAVETRRKLAARWKSVAFLRGGLLLVAFSSLLLPAIFAETEFVFPWYALSVLLFGVFLAVAFVHEQMADRIRTSDILAIMHAESINRINRQLSAVWMPNYQVPDWFAPVALDLDLFGAQSLYRLLATPRTPFGVQTLGDWICRPAEASEIRARQIAVGELKDQQAWRCQFRLQCEQLAASQSGPDRFVEWTASENWTDRCRGWLWFCRATAMTSILAFVLLFIGVLPFPIAMTIVMAMMAVHFVVSVATAGRIHDIFNSISSHHAEITLYRSLFREVAEFPSRSPFLLKIQRDLSEQEHDVQRHLKSLGCWNFCANIRRNGVLFLAYLVFQFLFMWDIHVLDRLERWKKRYGRNARDWFFALGQWEAILALSKLAHDNPDWVFPEIVDQKSAPVVMCRQLGHPLLDEHRVPNDVTVGPPGTVLLVTGSNMSGKSTLLRSLGVNVVLAQMGSVVCAAEMRLPPLHLQTSMRIVDSLVEGTSYFMAELKRLKEIISQTNSSRRHTDSIKYQPAPRCDNGLPEDRILFYLLDEILQGTNTYERHIAVSHVVRCLVSAGAIGAISTHDLDLAKTAELKDACVPVHFCESFVELDGKTQMTFDYRIREGIATTSNAIKLLEIVGLK